MTPSFHINITTPDKTIFDGNITSLIAPGEMGYLGILANHRPIVALLGSGRIILKYEKGRSETYRSEGGGILEFLDNRATLLLDSVRAPA
jgi:F-type H+-transporting ATPase subunit epsilon